jgi:hypothetical protein
MSIRPFTAADKARLYAFYSVIWPDRPPSVLDKRWWWLFDSPPLFLAEDDAGSITGACACIPFELFVGDGDQRRGGWLVDLFVLPTQKGKGTGRLLVEEASKHFDFLANVSQTDAALALLLRMGWSDRSYVSMYLCPSTRLSHALAKLRTRNDFDIKVGPARFGADFDELWQECKQAYAPLAVRDAAALSTRFATSSRPYKLITAHADGRLQGYFVLRTLAPGSIRSFRKHAVTLVADYMVAPGRHDVFTALLGASLALSRQEKVRHLACVASLPQHRSILRRFAFVGPEYSFLGAGAKKLAIGFIASGQAPAQRPWTLTPMDCDMDYILEAHG